MRYAVDLKEPEHIRKIVIYLASDGLAYAAKAGWAARPLDNCIELVRLAVAIIGQQNDYLGPALCWTGCKDASLGGSLPEIGFHNLIPPKLNHMTQVL